MGLKKTDIAIYVSVESLMRDKYEYLFIAPYNYDMKVEYLLLGILFCFFYLGIQMREKFTEGDFLLWQLCYITLVDRDSSK